MAPNRSKATPSKVNNTTDLDSGADGAAAGMLKAITSETTARMAAADLSEAGSVIRAKG